MERALPKIGERVRYIGCPPGERRFGLGEEPNIRWLAGGAEGEVLSRHLGFPSYRCSDHSSFPDCVCGDEGGVIPKTPPWVVVAYEAENANGFIERCVDLDGEGANWERVS